MNESGPTPGPRGYAVVDSHCHASTNWLSPVESLLCEMDRNRVEQAVLTQLLGDADNSYLFECARRFAGRFAVVVWVDSRERGAVQQLERLIEAGASGVRLAATDRCDGPDPLALWRAASRLGVTVTVRGEPGEFLARDFLVVLESLPGLRVVVEHLGTCKVPHTDPAHHDLQTKVLGLARFPNVHLKIHGLGEFCLKAGPPFGMFPFARPLPPLLNVAFDSFGPHRLIWGSDYPLVAAREGYSNSLELPMAEMASISKRDVPAIFGETARMLFPIKIKQAE